MGCIMQLEKSASSGVHLCLRIAEDSNPHFCVIAVGHKNVNNSPESLKIKIQFSCLKPLFCNFLVNFEWDVSCSSWSCLRSYLAYSWGKWNTCVLEEEDPQLFHHFISYE